MDRACEIVILGAAITDLQIYPVSKSVVDVASYPAEQMVWTVGGDTLNEATILTRLGHRVRMISCIGDDAPGAMILEHCRENHIDTAFLNRDPTKTTAINVGLIWKDGERTFLNNRSGSLWTFSPEDVDLSAVSEGKILSFASIFNNPLLDGPFLLELFRTAAAREMTICADMVAPKRGETLEDVREALALVDYFFPNYEEAARLTGETGIDAIADALLDLGVKNVLLKIGRQGCLVKNRQRRLIVPAYPDARCVDTTGAGDNFASGFICGLLEGLTLEECAQLANCAASLAIEAVGATQGVQSRKQVEARLADYLQKTNK
ncbi:sugar kinase [Pseudoflavonifractor sp. 60]|uniref:carbohydrate kinase family protein n=1 Tax=Pseudoflavonifractor sp. 60 TaxID=2304576 RepID=UPI00136ADDB7|nr:carbohydrate kinase family protein [Pseudoflavonifractor sp. 60]MCI8914479.1 carbohydrate kinase family protein [Lawsonibacter sp.]NBI68179.1 sugar kinase [Pseudoflavonifractor sp. 60]